MERGWGGGLRVCRSPAPDGVCEPGLCPPDPVRGEPRRAAFSCFSLRDSRGRLPLAQDPRAGPGRLGPGGAERCLAEEGHPRAAGPSPPTPEGQAHISSLEIAFVKGTGGGVSGDPSGPPFVQVTWSSWRWQEGPGGRPRAVQPLSQWPQATPEPALRWPCPGAGSPPVTWTESHLVSISLFIRGVNNPCIVFLLLDYFVFV